MAIVKYWDEATQQWVKTQAPKVESYTKTETDSKINTAKTELQSNIDSLGAEDVGARPNTWMPTAADVGALAAQSYITNGWNVDTLPDGVYRYNGWAHAEITCSVGLPFINTDGIWIKKTSYNESTSASNGDRVDTVINCNNGDVYTMIYYNGTWNKNAAAPAYTYGTEDMEAGVTPLEKGKVYFVYEVN
jgi:hypothetical protein